MSGGPICRPSEERRCQQHRPSGRRRAPRARRGGGVLAASRRWPIGVRGARRRPALDSGDTAWMLTSTALVLMMTIPGLAMFYGGMVRKKNVLAMSMQVFATCCLATLVWMVIGYSLAFGGEGPYLGGLARLFLARHDRRRAERHDPRERLHDLPDDLRDHHAGADQRRLRRPDEVLGDALVHGPVGDRRLRADRALGLGCRRLDRRPRRARLRRRHGGPHQLRHRRPGRRAACSASGSATAARTWRRTT